MEWITKEEHACFEEVSSQYELTAAQITDAKAQWEKEGRKGGRFYAYHAAHRFLAEQTQKN